ncbi:MAG: serine hydrolase domain-containing protein [Planctomycetota bacterium]
MGIVFLQAWPVRRSIFEASIKFDHHGLIRLRIVVLILSFAVAACSFLINHAHGQNAQLEQSVAAIMHRDQVPGVVYRVTQWSDQSGQGRVITEAAMGHRDNEATEPITVDDHFFIGSVSKLFVGDLFRKQLLRGEMKLEDTLQDYLPSYPGGDQITLAMLSNHTSGLNDLIAQKSFRWSVTLKPAKRWSLQELVSLSTMLPTDSRPGTTFRYSNVNTALLAHVLETNANQVFDYLMQTHLRDDLQLEHTGTGDLPEPHGHGYRHAKPNQWIGYGDQFTDVSFASPDWTGPAGNLFSTLDDLSNALPTIADRCGQVAASGIMPPSVLAHRNRRYGCQIEYRDDGACGHCGNVPGYSAAAWHYPAQKQTVVVLCNLSNAPNRSSPAETIADLLIRETIEH